MRLRLATWCGDRVRLWEVSRTRTQKVVQRLFAKRRSRTKLESTWSQIVLDWTSDAHGSEIEKAAGHICQLASRAIVTQQSLPGKHPQSCLMRPPPSAIIAGPSSSILDPAQESSIGVVWLYLLDTNNVIQRWSPNSLLHAPQAPALGRTSCARAHGGTFDSSLSLREPYHHRAQPQSSAWRH